MKIVMMLLVFMVLMDIYYPVSAATPTATTTTLREEKAMPQLVITVGTQTFKADFVDNATARAFQKVLPVTLTMEDLHSNEKYYYFSQTFPTDSERVQHIKNGDIMLYGADCLVIFYKDFPTNYAYTRMARIENPAELEAALGKADVTITFQLSNEL